MLRKSFVSPAPAERALEAVRGRGFLHGLRPELVDELLESASVSNLAAGQVDLPAGTAIVVSGLLAYFLLYPDGRQITIRYLTSGELVGAVSGSPSNVATGVRAIERSVLLRLNVERLRALAARHPELSMLLIDELTTRLRSAYRTLAMRSFGTVRARVARDLIARAQAHGRLTMGVQVPVTRQALADATGSVREVVTRALRDLTRQGIIEIGRSRITILDVQGLVREALFPSLAA